jgi:Protein of unknown function (DUF3293)
VVIPEHLESEFHRTLLTVQMGEGWLTIEDAVFSGHVITAWNPQSKSISLEENVKANLKLSRLLSELGKDFWPCIGKNPENTWREDGFAIQGLTDQEAKQLGITFDQLAVFKIDSGVKSIIDCS